MSSAPSELSVLLEDGPLLGINKPAGCLVQAPPGAPSLSAQVRAYLKQKYDKPGNVYLGVPHRLDRPVSGAMVFARNSKAAARLAEQFRERQVQKTYWAILQGTPPEPAGTLIDWLRKRPGEAGVEVVDAGTVEAQEAVLHYRTREMFRSHTADDSLTWVEIELITGRMHQIRAQFAARGCPIVGDTRYGAKQCGSADPDNPFDERIALHARALRLKHPIRYDDVELIAPVPVAWRDFAPFQSEQNA